MLGGVASAPEGSEALNIYNGVNDATAAAAIFVGDEGNSNAPRAYLNYILFDRDFNYVDAGFIQTGSGANTHHALSTFGNGAAGGLCLYLFEQ